MKSTQRILVTATVALLLGVSVAVVLGVPILPRRNLADELRCLSGIRHVRVKVDMAAMKEKADEQQRLRGVLTRTLERRGFEVTQQEDVPLLVIQYAAASNEAVPGGVVLTSILAVHQRVRLYRLNEDMTLPVAQVVVTNIGLQRELSDMLTGETERVADVFTDFVESASR